MAGDNEPSSPKAEKAAVRVMVRVRPFARRELGDDPNEYPMSILSMDGKRVSVMDHNGGLSDQFDFHETFWSIPEEQKQFCSASFADQNDVFLRTGTVAVESALKGYHTCIFAYGQTGSGKTHTMLGSMEDPGVAPRLVDHLFTSISEVQSKRHQWEHAITISFMEIYNERVKDLLQDKSILAGTTKHGAARRGSTKHGPTKSKKPHRRKSSAVSPRKHAEQPETPEYHDLRVRSSPATGIYVEGLTRLGKENGILTAEDVKAVMRAGMEYRSTAATAMNDTSSRSHAIFQICLTAKNPVAGTQRYAHINLVDLAGSERIKMSKVEGQSLTEATKINLSLSTLRRVIDILIENSLKKRNAAKQIAPYRDSMLTWILSESLGGNSKTMMIATVSPAESNREDTLNTLRYALKAKAIVNTVKINEAKSTVMLSAMQREMEQLRQKLQDSSITRSEDELEEMKRQQEDLEAEFQSNLKSIDEATNSIKKMEGDLIEKEKEVEEKGEVINMLRSENLEEKHMEAEAEHKLAIDQIQRKKSIVHEANRNVEEQQELLSHEVEIKKMQEGKVAAADTVLKTESHEKVYMGREFFREAFKKAFSLQKTALTVDQTLANLKTVSSGTSKMAMDIEVVCRETKDLEISNIRHAGHKAKLDREIHTTQKRHVDEVEDEEARLAALQDELEAVQKEVGVLERKARGLAFAARSVQRSGDPEMTGKMRAARKMIAEKRQMQREKKATVDEVTETMEVLSKLREDIVNENDYAKRKLRENKAKLNNTRCEAEGFKRNNNEYKQAIIEADDMSSLLQQDICTMVSKNAKLKSEREKMLGLHDELKMYASDKFFPKNGQAAVESPQWANTELTEQSISQRDANRAWVNSGVRYSKRQTSPSRSYQRSPTDGEGTFRRSDTRSTSTTTHSAPRQRYSRSDTLPSHPSPVPNPVLRSPSRGRGYF